MTRWIPLERRNRRERQDSLRSSNVVRKFLHAMISVRFASCCYFAVSAIHSRLSAARVDADSLFASGMNYHRGGPVFGI